MSNHHLSDTSFDSLGLHPLLLASLSRLGYDRCTPIQALTLPVALKGGDLAGQAQTGTGKTAAFLLAALHRMLSHPRQNDDQPSPRALVLAPTRELAVQIHQDALALADGTGLRLAVCFGGTGYDSQRQALIDGVDLLIGTPGRIIDYFKQQVFTLKQIEVVVLDEADRMFDLGFIADIRYLLRRMPPPTQRQNFLFSATLSHRVMELAYEHMNDPVKMEVQAEQVTADRVRQRLVHVGNDEKLPLLVGLLRQKQMLRTVVFVNTKIVAAEVEAGLRANGIEASILSGDVPQPKRLKLLEAFKDGSMAVLVATDVAARGLHVPDVSHVINYDLPQDAEDYVHRIGRTARAGASGDAISFCCESWVYSLPEIERYIERPIPVDMGLFDEMAADYIAPPGSGSAGRARGPRRGVGGGASGGRSSGRRRR